MAETKVVFDIIANDKASSKMSGVTKAAGLLAAGIGVMALKFGKDSVAAFKESEQSQLKLQDAFAKFPGLSDTNIGSLQKLNVELAKKTRFDDDATTSGQAVLAQYKLTGTQITALTPLLQDYAAKTGKDLPEAAGMLGKALLGKGKALAEVGIKFKDAGSVAANYTQITEGLRTQVGGFAEKEGKSAAGQAAIMGNQFGELQETVGGKLMPVITTLTGKLLQVIDFVSRNSAVILPLVATIGGLVGVVVAVNAATTVWASVTAAASAVNTVMFGTIVAETGARAGGLVALVAGTAGKIAHTVATVAMTVATGASTAAQWLLNAAMSANPFVLVALAVAALVAGIVIAYKNSETFRNIVAGAFDLVKKAGGLMWDGLKVAFDFIAGAFDTVGEAGRAVWAVLQGAFLNIIGAFATVAIAIVKGAATAFGWVPGLGGKLDQAVVALEDFKADVNKTLSEIHDKTINVVLKYTTSTGQGGGFDYNSQVPLAGRAIGGSVTAGVPYIVGERHAEVFMPNVNGTIIPRVPSSVSGGLGRSGGGDTYIELNVSVAPGGELAAAQKIRQMLLGLKRGLGGADLGIA